MKNKNSIYHNDHLRQAYIISIVIAITILFNCIAFASDSTKAEKQPEISWFKLAPELSAFWEIVPSPYDSLYFSLKPKSKKNLNRGYKRILVLFPKKSSADDTGLNRILRVFQSKNVAATFTAINFNKDKELGKEALEYARSERFDLLVSMGSSSTSFVHKHFRNDKIPVVSALSKDPVLLGQMSDYESGSKTNIAYTSVAVPLEMQMIYLKELKPRLINIGVLYGKNNKSAVKSQVKPLKKDASKFGVTIIDVAVESKIISDAAKELETLIPVAIKKMKKTDPTLQRSLFWITGSTTVFDNLETVCKVSDIVPVLSFSTGHVVEGEDSPVMAIGVSFASNAHMAAIYAINILQKKDKPGDLKVGVVSPPDIAINFLKARQIGLKIPFSFFESASVIFNNHGKHVNK